MGLLGLLVVGTRVWQHLVERAGDGCSAEGAAGAWLPVLVGCGEQCSRLPLIIPSLYFSDRILAGMLKLAPIPVPRPVPVSGSRLPTRVLLEGPQSFAGMIYPQELAVVHVVEETLGQPHASLTPLSHLCPSLPMLAEFAPGLQPISYNFF